jgi:hypothetical protein
MSTTFKPAPGPTIDAATLDWAIGQIESAIATAGAVLRELRMLRVPGEDPMVPSKTPPPRHVALQAAVSLVEQLRSSGRRLLMTAGDRADAIAVAAQRSLAAAAREADRQRVREAEEAAAAREMPPFEPRDTPAKMLRLASLRMAVGAADAARADARRRRQHAAAPGSP